MRRGWRIPSRAGWREEGFIVQTSGDGEDALHRRRTEPFDLAMLDPMLWDENFDSFSNVTDVTLSHLRARVDRGFDVPLSRLLFSRRGVLLRLEGWCPAVLFNTAAGGNEKFHNHPAHRLAAESVACVTSTEGRAASTVRPPTLSYGLEA